MVGFYATVFDRCEAPAAVTNDLALQRSIGDEVVLNEKQAAALIRSGPSDPARALRRTAVPNELSGKHESAGRHVAEIVI